MCYCPFHEEWGYDKLITMRMKVLVKIPERTHPKIIEN
jgi:hypothetical protein